MISISMNDTHKLLQRKRVRMKENEGKQKIEIYLFLYHSRPYNKAVTHPLNRLKPPLDSRFQ